MRKLQANVKLEYSDPRIARAIAEAISPDNFKTPKGLLIKTTTKNRNVVTEIRYDGKLPTFIATIDDLLFSISTAEKTLRTTIKLERRIP